MSLQVGFKSFKSSNGKVKKLAFHPTQLLLCYVDSGNSLHIMSLITEKVICSISTKYLEDCVSVNLASGKRVEDQVVDAFPKSTSSSIVDVCFMDSDCCIYTNPNHYHQFNKTYALALQTSETHLDIDKRLLLRKWLVVACENKIILKDYIGTAMHVIPKSVIDNKLITAIKVMYNNSANLIKGTDDILEGINGTIIQPVLVIGTISGTIYLVSPYSNHCYAKLVGAHKAAVTSIQVVDGDKSSAFGADRIISAAADGSIAYWEPSTEANNLGMVGTTEFSPRNSAKHHDGLISSMQILKYGMSGDSSDNQSMHVVTVGADRQIVVAQFPDITRRIMKFKPIAKGSLDCLSPCPLSGSYSNMMAISGSKPYVWQISYQHNHEVQPLINLEPYLPPGTKKCAKIYTIINHPIYTDVTAIGCNTGVALLSMKSSQICVAPSMQSSNFMECLHFEDGELWKKAYSYRPNESSKATDAPAVMNKKVILTFPKAKSQVNETGSLLGIVWSDLKEYGIYQSNDGETYSEVDSGHGSSIAWGSDLTSYCVLHQSKVSAPETKWTKLKRSKVKEIEDQMSLESSRLNLGIAKIHKVTGGEISLTIDSAISLFGGPVLSVSTIKPCSKGSLIGNSMKFYSWESGRDISPEIVCPRWIAWSKSGYAALGYDSLVTICKTKPTFSTVASLPISGSFDGHWVNNLLYITSLGKLWLVYVGGSIGSGKAPYVRSMELASFNCNPFPKMGKQNLFCLQNLSCPGYSKVATVYQQCVWLIDSKGLPTVVSTSNPGWQLLHLLSKDDPVAVLNFAEKNIPMDKHDEVAVLLMASFPEKGPETALKLRGLSLRMEMIASQMHGKLKRAYFCFQALAAGVTSAKALTSYDEWGQHLLEETIVEQSTAQSRHAVNQSIQQLLQRIRQEDDILQARPQIDVNRKQILDILAADLLEDEPSSEDELPPLPTISFPGNLDKIDWDAPLNTNSSATSATSKEVDTDEIDENEGEELEQNEVSREEQERIATYADEGLYLVDMAIARGEEALARATLCILLKAVDTLPTQSLQKVLTRCASCQLTDELKDLIDIMISEGAGVSAESVSLISALVEDTVRLSETLRSAGMIALSALASHSWHTVTQLQDKSDWASLLSSASGNGVQFSMQPANKF